MERRGAAVEELRGEDRREVFKRPAQHCRSGTEGRWARRASAGVGDTDSEGQRARQQAALIRTHEVVRDGELQEVAAHGDDLLDEVLHEMCRGSWIVAQPGGIAIRFQFAEERQLVREAVSPSQDRVD